MNKTIGIGIDIGGTTIKYGLIGPDAYIYWYSEKPTEALTSAEVVIKNILDAAEECMGHAKNMNLEVISIGIGTPGLIKDNDIIVGGANNISDWNNVALGTIVSKHFNLPAFVANDADMMGLGEFTFSKCLAKDTVLFFTLGTGIGGAIFINGELFQGHFGMGGELGVFPIIINGKVTYWEDVASTSALIKCYKEACGFDNGEVMDGKLIVQNYLSGEKEAVDTIDTITNYIGMGLGGYVNIFNPKQIIIGGGISQSGDFFLKKIIDKTRTYALEECMENVEIKVAALGNKAGFVGASLLGISKTSLLKDKLKQQY